MSHIPVLLREVLAVLDVRPYGLYIDATLGGGGYTRSLLHASHPHGRVLALDADEDALARVAADIDKRGLASWILDAGSNTPHPFGDGSEAGSGSAPAMAIPEPPLPWSGPRSFSERLTMVNANFRDIQSVALSQGFTAVDGVVFDIGLSSMLIEQSGRGFTFRADEPLLMTFAKAQALAGGRTARDVVNTYTRTELARVFREYAEEPYANRLAEKIVERRKLEPIMRTFELRDIVLSALPSHRMRMPQQKTKALARVFQALRIEVNDELNALSGGISGAWECLRPGGRLAVVSFHSLEDRIVKNFFREKKSLRKGTILTAKPTTPSTDEIKSNPRARSARLRAIQKTHKK